MLCKNGQPLDAHSVSQQQLQVRVLCDACDTTGCKLMLDMQHGEQTLWAISGQELLPIYAQAGIVYAAWCVLTLQMHLRC
jgi:hypothetical protein